MTDSQRVPTSTYTVLLWPDAETGDVAATVPALPGCVAQGRSREEALLLIHDAIRMHTAGLIEDGQSLPVEDASAQVETVSITV